MSKADGKSVNPGTVRDAAFKLFRDVGLTTIFGNPGSTELPMFRGFPKDFRYVLGLQESVVVGMADGHAQASKHAALINLHSAVGVGHAMGSIFTAYKNQTPLVITAGQQARSILPYEPFLYSEQAANLPKPYVKWSCEPARAEDVPHALARAYYTAMQSPRGPTLVSVPIDDWDRPCEPLAAREVSQLTVGDPALLAKAAAMLSAAQHPVIVVGPSIARDDAWAETIELAERHQTPVWASPRSPRNAFPEDHRLFAGFLPPDRAQICARLAQADLILVLGAPVFTYHVEGQGPHAPPGASLIHLTDEPGSATWAPVGLSIVTHLKHGIGALLKTPAPDRSPPVARPHAKAVTGLTLTDAFVMSRLAALRDRHSIIVEEAPSSRGALTDYLPMLEPDTFHTCASGGLGHGLAAAVGVALAKPTQKVIAILGDGSAMYAIQALWTAAELKLPIAFLIINNGGYQALNEFGRLFDIQELQGTSIDHLDFCALANGHGVTARRVDRPEDLDSALTAALTPNALMLIDIRVVPA